MFIKLKRGNFTDLYIEMSPVFSSVECKLSLQDVLNQNGILYSELPISEQKFPTIIKFYINYDMEIKKKKQFKDSKIYAEKSSNSENRINSLSCEHKLTILYVHPDVLINDWDNLMRYIDNFETNLIYDTDKKNSNNQPKLILLFEDAYEAISSIKEKSQKKRLDKLSESTLKSGALLSNNNKDHNQNQINDNKSPKKSSSNNKLKNLQTLEESGLYDFPFKNDQGFDDWLMSLSMLNENIDYKMTEDVNESMDYLVRCIIGIISSKHKNKIERFECKTTKHTTKSIFAGFQDFYTLAWVEMLMALPGIPEEKAIAIVKKYPNVHSLMEAYDNETYTDEQKQNMLADLEIVYHEDDDQPKHIGKNNSNRIYKIFNSKDHFEHPQDQ